MIFFSLVNCLVVLNFVILSVVGLQPLRTSMEGESLGQENVAAGSLRAPRSTDRRIIVKLLYTTTKPPPPSIVIVNRGYDDVAYGHRQLNEDKRQLGTDQRQLGKDQSQLGSDQSQLGSDQSQLERDRRRLEEDQRQLSRDQRRNGGRRYYDGIIDDRRRRIFDRNLRSSALRATEAP